MDYIGTLNTNSSSHSSNSLFNLIQKSKGSMESNPSSTPSNPSDPNPENFRAKTRKEKQMGPRRGAGEASMVTERGGAEAHGRAGERREKSQTNVGHPGMGDKHGQKKEAVPCKTLDKQPRHEAQHEQDVRNAPGHRLISKTVGIPGDSLDRDNQSGPAPNPLPPSQFPVGVCPPQAPPMGPMGFQNHPLQALMGFNNMPPEEMMVSSSNTSS